MTDFDIYVNGKWVSYRLYMEWRKRMGLDNG